MFTACAEMYKHPLAGGCQSLDRFLWMDSGPGKADGFGEQGQQMELRSNKTTLSLLSQLSSRLWERCTQS